VLGPTATDGATHIAITESGGSHDEVSAALIHAFGKQENAQLQTYFLLQRYGIKQIIADFNLTNKIPPSKSFEQFKSSLKTQVPNILVMTTCELDSPKISREMHALLARGETYLFCFIHHAERWSTNGYRNILKPWVEKEMVQFVSLSPHTAHFLEMNSLSQWDLGTQPKIKALTPVFPVTLAPSNSSRKYEDLDFALQGNYDPERRDYRTIFEHLGNFLQQDREEGVGPRSSSPGLYSPKVGETTNTNTDAAETEDAADVDETAADAAAADADGSSSNDAEDTSRAELVLHLLGHGKHPAVPADLRPHVTFDEGLNYTNFYTILSRTFALLPGFASSDYLDRKASSSVPASLIAGVPIVATQDILNAYSYLRADAVWMQEEGETDLDVVGRVLSMTREQRVEKMRRVREVCAWIIEKNTKRVGLWVKEGLERVQEGQRGKKLLGDGGAEKKVDVVEPVS